MFANLFSKNLRGHCYENIYDKKMCILLLLGLALTLFLNFGAVFASNGNRCLNEDLDITNNLCEQNCSTFSIRKQLVLC